MSLHTCTWCGHIHDPEDGRCDAHAHVGLGPCPCPGDDRRMVSPEGRWTTFGTWSRARIREHNGLPSRWNFDGVPVGLIGYRGIDGTPVLLPGPALCEWNRRRSASSEEGSDG